MPIFEMGLQLEARDFIYLVVSWDSDTVERTAQGVLDYFLEGQLGFWQGNLLSMQLQVNLTRYETEACPSGGLCAPSTTQAVISGCNPILETFEVFAVVCGGIAVVGLPQLPEMPEALVSVKFGVCMSLSVANIQRAMFPQAGVPLAFAADADLFCTITVNQKTAAIISGQRLCKTIDSRLRIEDGTSCKLGKGCIKSRLWLRNFSPKQKHPLGLLWLPATALKALSRVARCCLRARRQGWSRVDGDVVMWLTPMPSFRIVGLSPQPL